MNTFSDTYSSLKQQWQADPNVALCWSSNDAYTIAHCSGGFLDPNGTGSPAFGAVEYCQYLKQDGSGINCSGVSPSITCTPVNYWHLPTEAELMAEMDNEYLPGGAGFTPSYIPPGGFQYSYSTYRHYWSSSAYSSSNAWLAGIYSYRYVYSTHGIKNYQYLVRCVH
jgi:hypothetical protein